MGNARGTRLAGFAIVMACGCAHEVYSPPTRAMPLESAAALSSGEESAQVEVSESSAMFGPEVSAGTVRMRRGDSDVHEFQLDLSRAKVGGTPQPGVSPSAHAARVGFKSNPTATDNVAVVAGAGGGWSAGGTFASVDVGMVLSYEACYLTPTLAGRGFVSEPLDAREVDITEGSMPAREYVETPRTTYGVSASAVLSLALGRDRCDARAPVTLHAGVGFMQVTDRRNEEGFAQGSVGVEVSF